MTASTPSDLPPHHSPVLAPTAARPSAQYLKEWTSLADTSTPPTPGVPGLLSPQFTPPATPGASTPSRHLTSEPKSTPVDTDRDDPAVKKPRLVERLPNVECVVRARIPTTSGSEMFLHLYQNDSDNKEHLAIVFGNNIRSKSLDAERQGESEMDRMIRGAYVGRLTPGRVSSRVDPVEKNKRRSGAGLLKRSGSRLKNVETPETVVEGEVLDTMAKPDSESLENPSVASLTIQEEEEAEPEMDDEARDSEDQLQKPPLVRIHSECYTGETAWSARCDCGEQLDEAARLMSLPSSNGGVIVYLRQEGRGIGLASKLKAYNLQDLGNDTVEANLLLRHPADARTYGLATAILCDLGLGKEQDDEREEGATAQSEEGVGIRLLTNNPEKVRAVEGPNKEIRVRERVAMVPLAWRTGGSRGIKGVEIERYLDTKIRQMGHMIHE
jgi:GTP cyclohydrolase II